MSYQSDIAELENCLDLNKPVTSRVMPRWQRKAAQGTPAKASSRCPASTPKRTPKSDRFIPNRSAMDMEVSRFNLMKKEGEESRPGSPSRQYCDSLAANVFSGANGAQASATAAAGGGGAKDARVLAFRQKAPAPSAEHQSSLKVLYSSSSDVHARRTRATRHIPSAPERILDAPELMDDYYLNLLDWSSTNVLAVALGGAVYLWDKGTGDISELMQCESPDDYISSVSWISAGSHLAVGTAHSEVQLWDVAAQRRVRTMDGHSARVGSLAWNQHILTSGSRDATVVQHDVRVAQHNVGTLRQHEQEVCGLAWSPDGATLASGANDNLLCLWDWRMDAQWGQEPAPRHVLTDHTAAVKALAWCPWQRNVLATGGGTADRCIKTWNASTGALLDSVDTGSQVCSLLWSTHERELLSSHGFAQNQLTLWAYPSMARIKELTGHTARALHLAAGPDGASVCSAGADETLRFWNVFGEARASAKGKGGGSSAPPARRMLGGAGLR